MAVRELFVIALILCVNGLNVHNGEESALQEVLRRIGQLEENDRHHQLELETLRKQNAALVHKVNNMAERDIQQSSRIAALEERESVLIEKLKQLIEEKNQKSKLVPEFSDDRDVLDADTDDEPDVMEHTTESRDEVLQNIGINGEKQLRAIGHNRIRQAESGTPVSFFVTLDTDGTILGQGQPVVFDNVITNNGNGYHQFTGVFTVPVSGVYVFATTMFNRNHYAHYEYNVNGKFVSRMFVDDRGDYHTASQTAILNLKQGDDVTIRNIDLNVPVHGNNYSSFAGFLLTTSEGNGVSAIVG